MIRFQFETVLSIDKCDCEQPEDGFSAYEYGRIPFYWYTHLDLNWVAVSPRSSDDQCQSEDQCTELDSVPFL
jgi:hypothetical protein